VTQLFVKKWVAKTCLWLRSSDTDELTTTPWCNDMACIYDNFLFAYMQGWYTQQANKERKHEE